MSSPRYPSYASYNKPTFAELPAHWRVVHGRHLVTVQTGSGDTVDADENGEFPFYVRSDSPLRSSAWEFDTKAVLTAGDGAGVAKVFHLVSGKFMAHQRVYVLHDFREVTPEFFFYSFKSLFHLMALDGSAKSTVDSVRRHMITDMPIGIPPTDEQRAIADYLDYETAQIDALVAKQEEFIGLLRERRVAAIDSLVWSGLDSEAEDSETGIGPKTASPRHWRRLRNKNIFREISVPSKEGSEELLTVSHLTGVTPRSLKNVNMFEAVTTAGYKVVEVGDLAINTMWAWMGALGVSRYRGIVSPAYGVYRPTDDSIDGRYFDCLYRTPRYVVEMTRHSRGVTSSRLRLYPDVFLRLNIVVPPTSEQVEIADRIDEQTSRIDTLIAKAEEHIALAKERRAALITAAVTGQFDVRTARKAG